LMTGKLVNFDGYLLSKTLYKQIVTINLLSNSFVLHQNILILHISKNKNGSNDGEINQLYRKVKTENNRTELLSLNEDLFWKDNKIYKPQARNMPEAIVNWLHRIYHS
jgi:hypothetical protein